ncbi:class I SAM-dependent methyltransferase [Ammoniphilus sp. 3BR4]
MDQTLSNFPLTLESNDPWFTETDKDLLKRKEILLAEIPQKKYKNVLDIGCGNGLITRDLPGEKILGIDNSKSAVSLAANNINSKVSFKCLSIYNIPQIKNDKYDLIVLSGLMYPHYIKESLYLIYCIIDQHLSDTGILITNHIDKWYKARFPFLMVKEYYYEHLGYTTRIEVYTK